MLCILSFIIFLILFPFLCFFRSYRVWLRRSWSCVFKKVTLQPCEMNVGEELKSKLTSKIVLRFPRVAKFLRQTFTFWAVAFVILNLWSVWSVFNAGLNLWVYDTCDRVYAESCSLSGEACGVSSGQLSLWQAASQGKIISWVSDTSKNLVETISLVPVRFQSWPAENYLAPKPTYYAPFDPAKETVLEVMDPSCSACRKLFGRLKEAEIPSTYNLTYLLYPIPNAQSESGYKFRTSYLFATYVEALKDGPLPIVPNTIMFDKTLPVQAPDWWLLQLMFTDKDNEGVPWQDGFNLSYSEDELEVRIHQILKSRMGYSDQQIKDIQARARSDDIKSRLELQRQIVEQRIHTIRIPTLLFHNRRYDRVVDLETLRQK